MSNQTTPKKKLEMDPKYLGRLTLVLLGFSAIVALLLGLVNGVTADKIAVLSAEKTATAMAAVVEDASSEFETMELSDAAVAAAAGFNSSRLIGMSAVVVGGETVGTVCQVITGGSQGDITMVVGLDMNSAVTGTSIIKMVETAGLGTKAKEEPWLAQYLGGSEPFAVDKDGGAIAAITGATVSSRAVTTGVNAAMAAAKTLG